MDGNFKLYDWVESSARIAEILNKPADQFTETEALPDRDELTYTNGFYGQCSAVFVDIRDSSGMTKRHKRPALAKIYRAFVSEMVAVLNSDPYVREVNIVGDCVWASYNTPRTTDIDDVFEIAFTANSLGRLLNCRLADNNIDAMRIGIGVDWGRVLMIKAGYAGSDISDVVYMGDVVNHAAHLAHKASRGLAHPIWVGNDFFGNLNDHNRGLLQKTHDYELGIVYTGNAIHKGMNAWIDAGC